MQQQLLPSCLNLTLLHLYLQVASKTLLHPPGTRRTGGIQLLLRGCYSPLDCLKRKQNAWGTGSELFCTLYSLFFLYRPVCAAYYTVNVSSVISPSRESTARVFNPPEIYSREVSVKRFGESGVWCVQFPTPASPELEGPRIFTNSFFIYFFGRRGKSGQGVPLNGSNLEKWIEPGFLMAPARQESATGKVFQTETLALRGSPSPPTSSWRVNVAKKINKKPPLSLEDQVASC